MHKRIVAPGQWTCLALAAVLLGGCEAKEEQDTCNLCTLGERDCAGTTARICQAGADGCAAWLDETDCGPLGQTCQNGACFGGSAPTCNPPCDPGQACVEGVCQGVGTGCDPPCGPTEACVAGTCQAAAPTCDPPCPPSQSCVDGACICNACVPAEMRCSTELSAVEVCRRSSGCTQWDKLFDCTADQVCSDGKCLTCASECVAGEHRCGSDGKSSQACDTITGCLRWGAATACPGGGACAGGICDFDAAQPHKTLISAVPDFLQSEKKYGSFANEGINHCAPAAASNWLMWLDNNGWPKIANDSADRTKDQFDLIVELASSAVMNTDPGLGTSPGQVLSGLKAFVGSRGYAYTKLRFEGFRKVANEFATGVTNPELDWIKAGIASSGAVMISLGFYTHDAATNTYERFLGHWVTLVGYGHDGSKNDPLTLIIHDPHPSAGAALNHYVQLIKMTSGTLTTIGGQSGLPRPAKGYYRMAGEMHMPSMADAAVLEGAVVLRLMK